MCFNCTILSRATNTHTCVIVVAHVDPQHGAYAWACRNEVDDAVHETAVVPIHKGWKNR